MTTTHGASELGQPAASALHVLRFFEKHWRAFQAWHKRLFDAFSSWRKRRRQRAELDALSDVALKDIGINRAEIEGIVNSPNRDASGRVR